MNFTPLLAGGPGKGFAKLVRSAQEGDPWSITILVGSILWLIVFACLIFRHWWQQRKKKRSSRWIFPTQRPGWTQGDSQPNAQINSTSRWHVWPSTPLSRLPDRDLRDHRDLALPMTWRCGTTRDSPSLPSHPYHPGWWGHDTRPTRRVDGRASRVSDLARDLGTRTRPLGSLDRQNLNHDAPCQHSGSIGCLSRIRFPFGVSNWAIRVETLPTSVRQIVECQKSAKNS